LDDPAIGTVFARCPEGGGMACAVRNRLSKAAAFRVIDAEQSPPCAKGGVGKADGGIVFADNDPSVACGDSSPCAGEPLIIGITGGTGCGKTTLLGCIEEKGGTVIDCDALYHGLLQTDPQLLANIEKAFPGVVEDGVLQRKKLGAMVFADPEKLAQLNAITHSAVKKEVLRLLENAKGLVAIDAIGLFEGGLADLCHTTVAVTAPEDLRIKRLMARDGISEEYARSRIAAQHDGRWFSEHCAHTLENNGTKEEFNSKCLAFLSTLGIM